MDFQGGLKNKLEIKQSQRLVMTPQLQQAIKLLQLSRLELAQEINQQLLDNPVLEETLSDTPDDSVDEYISQESGDQAADAASTDDTEQKDLTDEADLKWDDYYEEEDRERIESSVMHETSDSDYSYEQTLTAATSLGDHLLWQLGLKDLSALELEIGRDIIGNINDDGYLETPIEEIAQSLDISKDEVEKTLCLIQTFDPSGVGARNLTECLLIQIQALSLSGSLVETIVRNHLADIEKRHYQQIAKACNVSMDEVLQAAKVIEHLEPKPGRPFCASDNVSMTPDVFVVKRDNQKKEGIEGIQVGSYVIFLNDDGLPKLRISGYYRSLLRSKSPESENVRAYLEGKFRSASWLVRSLDQRNRTIMKVAESIVKFQYPFMENGVRALKPLVLRQVADEIEMHESTVSRVTANKHIDTPQGIYPMKFFFNGALSSSEGSVESCSSVAVRDRIERMVSEEDAAHPLTDQKIVAQLKKENIEIARRTVSKYRAELKIASASRRGRPAIGTKK